jgi:hypothetical protein
MEVVRKEERHVFGRVHIVLEQQVCRCVQWKLLHCQTSREKSRQASGRSFPEKGGSV